MNNAPFTPRLSQRQRWLVVDDERDLSELIANILTGLDLANVQNFTVSVDALSAVSSHGEQFDLVITDRDMPGLDGLELARRIHARTPATKVILLSANTSDLAADALSDTGIGAIMTKPFNLARLEETVRALSAADAPRFSPALAWAA